MSSYADITPDKINLMDLQLSAPDGNFRGAAQIAALKRIAVKGQISGVTIAEVGKLAGRPTGSLDGVFSGAVELDGQLTASGLAAVNATAAVDLKPGGSSNPGAIPVQGALDIHYDQRAGKLELGDSRLDVGSTHAGLSGTLGENLAVHVVSRNLNDALPVLRAFGAQPPAQWPVELQGSVARIDASVQGGFPDAKISGTADAGKLQLDGRQLDHVTSTFAVDRSSVFLQATTVEQGKMRLQGNGRAGLHEWSLQGTSPVSATVSLRSADIPTLAAEAGWKAPPATGLVSAAVRRISGSLESPLVSGRGDARKVSRSTMNISERLAPTLRIPLRRLSSPMAKPAVVRGALL